MNSCFARLVGAASVALGLAVALPAPAAALDLEMAARTLAAERDRMAVLAATEEAWSPPAGPALRRGDIGPDVAALRARLGRLHPDLLPDPAGEAFDEALHRAVLAFQRRHGLEADGIAGAMTLAALNAPAAELARRLDLNVARLEATAAAIEGAHRFVLVNLPGYTLTASEGGAAVLESRVVVGKPSTPTPVMASRFISLKLNPDWNPPSSLNRQYLARLARGDVAYLRNRGLRILDRDGTELPLEQASAADFGALGLRFWQPPGPGNALGLLKFEIDAHGTDIYLHDTNERRLFGRERRAFSAGCVRVERWAELAAWLIDATPERVRGMGADGRTFWRRVPGDVPLVLAYLTAFPAPDGTVAWHPDVYGLDRAELAEAQTAGAMRLAAAR